jgi:hypothetical protein
MKAYFWKKRGKEEMKTRHFLLCLVVLMSLLLCGCAPARSESDYLTKGGRGEIVGSLNGMDFSAVVAIGKNGENISVEYLSPTSLKGLVLTSGGGACEVRLGELCFTCEREEVEGFLLPATAFLAYGDAKSVQKEGENTVLTFPTGSVLTLSPKGEPISLSGENIDVRVVWWQSGTEKNTRS